MKEIQSGDEIILYLDKKRTYKVAVERDKRFHTHKGFIELGELIGEPYGAVIYSSLGKPFYALKPIVRDHIIKTDRRTQVLYPKDIGYIIHRVGIGSGSRVLEAGTGSGALTIALADAVRPHGRVYTYDINKEFQEVAEGNIERAGLLSWVETKNKDVAECIDEEDLDAVILDMASPWKVVENVWNALAGSGFFLSFSPTIEQVMKTVFEMNKYPFIEQETIELILRKITVARDRTRPQTRMLGHSGYITSARKVLEMG